MRLLSIVLPAAVCCLGAGAQPPLLLQRPLLRKDQIVFAYAGGDAVRLTNAPGIETGAIFSPDGAAVAFLGQHNGNFDVYTVRAAGGVPKRVTFHPGRDEPAAFSPDGKQILFQSLRTSSTRATKLFMLPLGGGPETEVPLPMAHWASYSPDGKRLAYTPLAPAFEAWKGYRGGRTSAIWLADLSGSSIEKILRQNSNGNYPMWSGGRLGYVHLPNTSVEGYTNFNRYFFAQTGKEGIVIDERFNGGGFVADYIIDYLRRPLLNYFTTRAGAEFSTPMNSIFGPKAMIVNEWAGSGGDAMPWMFRKLKIGPLIGKRTWGGLVGIFGFSQMGDKGSVLRRRSRFSWKISAGTRRPGTKSRLTRTITGS